MCFELSRARLYVAMEAAGEVTRRRDQLSAANPALIPYLPQKTIPKNYHETGVPGAPTGATTDPNKAEELKPKEAKPDSIQAIYNSLGDLPKTKDNILKGLREGNLTLPEKPSANDLYQWRSLGKDGEAIFKELYGYDLPPQDKQVPVDPLYRNTPTLPGY